MIRIVEEYSDVLELLYVYKNRLSSLSTGRVNPDEMAKKFSQNATVLECIEEANSIGFCAFYHNDHINKKAYVSMIAVDSLFEGRGYASNLLLSMETICKEDGMMDITLEVSPSNKRAIDFYSKHGFIATDTKSSNGNLVMCKDLI